MMTFWSRLPSPMSPLLSPVTLSLPSSRVTAD